MENKANSSSIFREFDGLGIQVINVLVKNGILTLEDLLYKTETELLMLRNMGPSKVTFIRKWLHEKGLDLKPESLSISLKEFDGLDTKTVNILVKNGILTLENLLSKKETELLMLRNMGPSKVTFIRKWLHEKGLDLKPESPSISLKEFDGLDIQTAYVLVKNGILTLEDLLSKKETELLMIRSLGQGRIILIRKWLIEKGLDLKPEFSSFSVKLSDCKDLNSLTARLLMNAGILTLEDLLSKTEKDVILIEGICPYHFLILRKWLRKYHLCFATN